MKIRIPTTMDLILGVVFSLMIADQCLAQFNVPKGVAVEGFGKLTWGVSVEQALSIYHDLYFGKYVIEDVKQEPSKIYYRKDETGRIYDAVFDSIEYWFKDNRFYKIKAVMHSRIGPRTLVTRSEEAFDQLHKYFIRKHGEPTRYNESYFTDFITVVRDVEWNAGDVSIVLKYKGPEATNEDQLILELVRGGRI